MTAKKKLIEVALPLEAINRESAREKFIRHGHPSTLHTWWARRPLAACRATLFAQLVDDPSANPDLYPTEEMQSAERQRLFRLIEDLVKWENSNDELLLNQARELIRSHAGGTPVHVQDPFAGGGSIPLEASRLGLEVTATDLNPVAVLLNRGILEFPAQNGGAAPVWPGASTGRLTWPGATGLAEDVRRYADWMREAALVALDGIYPVAGDGESQGRPVMAWLWTRTVKCPNPACGVDMPLVKSFWLSKKVGRKTWIRPRTLNGAVSFDVVQDESGPSIEGTIGRNGAVCIACDTPVALKYIREFGKSRGLKSQLMAVVVQGERRREYLEAPQWHQDLALSLDRPTFEDVDLPHNPRDFKTPNYGLSTFGSLFSARQLTMLMTFSGLVREASLKVYEDATAAGLDHTRATEYSRAVSLYLGLTASRMADRHSTLCAWMPDPKNENARNVFARQALPMVWDYAELNPFGEQSGNFSLIARAVATVIEALPAMPGATVGAGPAQSSILPGTVISTDPPYYDNIGYADLSDFFYLWLRQSLAELFPLDTATLQTPKSDELVASPYRFGGQKRAADEHFESGFIDVFTQARISHNPSYPMTLFYAFKQSENVEEGVASTGWETLLSALTSSGWSVTATWPMRTEMSGRMIGKDSNALASSIVLACRPRSVDAQTVSRRAFLSALKSELPAALKNLQQGSIAPVDLAQAAIGPGMAVFSRYARVVEADGAEMTVKTALALINQVLSEVLEGQESDFDAVTRFAVKWFTQYGWNDGPSGDADVLSRATGTTVVALERGGIFKASAGRARLLEAQDMTADWSPVRDQEVSIWEVAVRVGNVVSQEGIAAAAGLLADAGTRVDLSAVKELAYLMYSTCEKKGWQQAAALFNDLGTSWGDLTVPTAVRSLSSPQAAFEFDSTED